MGQRCRSYITSKFCSASIRDLLLVHAADRALPVHWQTLLLALPAGNADDEGLEDTAYGDAFVVFVSAPQGPSRADPGSGGLSDHWKAHVKGHGRTSELS